MRCKSQPDLFTKLDLAYSSLEPLIDPIALTLPDNGLRLRFDGPDQRLRLIEVLDFTKTTLTYKGIELVKRPRSSEGAGVTEPASIVAPSFKHVYSRLFGPTYAGEYCAPENGQARGTYILSYPGIALTFPVKHKSWSDKSDFVSLLSSTATANATSLAIFAGGSWTEARVDLFTKPIAFPRSLALSGRNPEHFADELEAATITRLGQISFARKNSPPLDIVLNETTPQDLIIELGPPDAIYYKMDNRITIHGDQRHNQQAGSRQPNSTPEGHITSSMSLPANPDDPSVEVEDDARSSAGGRECFYNYFHHGLDVLVSPPALVVRPDVNLESGPSSIETTSELVATKVLIHGNVPGSFPFNRHRRLRWQIELGDKKLDSECRFHSFTDTDNSTSDERCTDGQDAQPLQRGMVLNRGWGSSPDSSIELLGGFGRDPPVPGVTNETDAVSLMHNTELFGFPGLLFEVLKNDTVSCLTVY